MAFLQGPSPKQEEMIKQELNEMPGDLERGVRDLRSMCAVNPYLPNPESLVSEVEMGGAHSSKNDPAPGSAGLPDPLPGRPTISNESQRAAGFRRCKSEACGSPCKRPLGFMKIETHLLKNFLRGCRMDFERARKKLETFCYSRSRYRDLFEHRSLNEPPLNDICKFLDIVPLPKLTDEGLRVTIFRVRPNYPESSADVAAAARAVLLISDARMHDEGLIAGDAFVWECSHVRASLATRVALAAGTVRRSIHLAHAAYPQRMRRIHVVGAPALVASSISLMRSCVNEKIKKRYYLHSKTEELFDHFPSRVLPVEWGGEEESIEVLAKKWRHRVDDLREYLRHLNELCDVTPDEAYEDNIIYGAVGSFRKLDID